MDTTELSNRLYRFIFGLVLLVALYFEAHYLVYAVIIISLVEAVTNWRIPLLVSRLRFHNDGELNEGSLGINFRQSIPFDAERMWRITVVLMLAISYFSFPDTLWFFPWFMGFAILGAGISGVCPIFLGIKWLGFR
jgi:hypothetical protein